MSVAVAAACSIRAQDRHGDWAKQAMLKLYDLPVIVADNMGRRMSVNMTQLAGKSGTERVKRAADFITTFIRRQSFNDRIVLGPILL